MTSVAVIGSGRIGAALARKWAATGHAVTLGARSPTKPAVVELADQIGAERAEIEDAVRRSDVVVFAIPGKEIADTLSRLGGVLDGKLVIDAANNVGGEHDGAPRATIEQLIADVGFGPYGSEVRRMSTSSTACSACGSPW